MKNKTAFLLSLAATIAGGSCTDPGIPGSAPEQIQQAVVAPTVLHVSPTGSGTTCSQAAPCSLVGARDKARTINSAMTADILIQLADGVYTLTTPFTLRENATTHDSGTNGHDIIYQPEPGARPTLSGGSRITGFTLWDQARKIYRAAVPASLRTRQVYVNGVRGTRARGPAGPTHLRRDAQGWTGPDGSLASWRNPGRVEVVDLTRWKGFRCPVSSITNKTWHNVVASSTGQNFAYPGDWSAPNPVTDGGRGTTYHVGDFDGDGYTDLLFAYKDSGGLWHNDVALSDRGGSFTWPWPSNWLPVAGQGTTYHIGDFNGDGKSDLLFAYMDGTGHWRNEVALSNGHGFAFTSPANWLPDAGQGTTYHIGNFDGDSVGKSDLLFSYMDGTGHWRNEVALSNGHGFAFTSPANWLPDAGQGTTYHVGNFDGDAAGKTDLLFAYMDGTGHWRNEVALSNGHGFAFSSPANWLPDAGQGTTYHVGDYSGDGKSDLLFAYMDADGRWRNEVALSSGGAFLWAPTPDWLPDTGHGLQYFVGNFAGPSGDRKSDLLFAGYDAAITIQDPCWVHAHSHTEGPGMDDITWFENALELLDQPGEWYLDESEHFLYYLPRPGENLSTMPVVAATLQTLVDGRGDAGSTPSRLLHNIQWKGITFAFAGWLEPSTSGGYAELQAGWHGDFSTIANPARTPGNVSFAAASALRFEGNIFTHLGGVGLDLAAGTQNTTVVGNVFTDISSTAIQIGEVSDANKTTTDTSKQSRNNSVVDNYVNQAGAEYQGAVGIFVGYSDGLVVRHNEISMLPYTGVSVGWGWAPNKQSGCSAFSYSRNNALSANWIHDVMQTMYDGGGIYTLSPQPGSTTDSNHIRNVGHGGDENPQANALYHDQGTCFFTDQHNVISGAWAWLSMWHESIKLNTVINNYVEVDRAICPNGLGLGPTSACAVQGNVVSPNTFTGGSLPPAAQSVIAAAGLEPAYQAIKNPVCGDATCNPGETASTCPKDCR